MRKDELEQEFSTKRAAEVQVKATSRQQQARDRARAKAAPIQDAETLEQLVGKLAKVTGAKVVKKGGRR